MSDNPWTALPDQAPYVLPGDREAVEAHNAKAEPDTAFVLDLLPEPFLGPQEPAVVFLNLNPGFAEADYEAHGNDDFRQASLDTLRHAAGGYYPMYLLDPALEAFSGPRWWRKRLRVLSEAVEGGYETLGRRLLVIEWLGYHSKSFKKPKQLLPSQEYGANLLRAAMARNCPVVVMRSGALWSQVVPELSDYPWRYAYRSVQSPYCTPNNCPDGFPVIVDSFNRERGSFPRK